MICDWPRIAAAVIDCEQERIAAETPTTVAGILLAVTIIYQYFETYEKERAQQGGALF